MQNAWCKVPENSPPTWVSECWRRNSLNPRTHAPGSEVRIGADQPGGCQKGSPLFGLSSRKSPRPSDGRGHVGKAAGGIKENSYEEFRCAVLALVERR